MKYFSTRLLQTDGFEDLGAGVGHVGGDAHLGHDLAQPLLTTRLDEVLGELLGLLGITLGRIFMVSSESQGWTASAP